MTHSHFRIPEDDLPNFHEVSPGVLRGGQPSGMGFSFLKRLGVRTILNLRDERYQIRSEELVVLELGFIYINIPLSPFIEPSAAQIDSCLEVLQSTDHTPVFVHCLHGMDRTGTIISIYRLAAHGWTLDRAVEEAINHGFHPEFDNLTRAVHGFHGRLLK